MDTNLDNYFQKSNNDLYNKNHFDYIIKKEYTTSFLYKEVLIEPIFGSIKKTVDKVNPVTLYNKARDKIKGEISGIINKMTSPITTFGETVKNNIQEEINNIINGIKNEFNSFIDNVKNQVETTINNIRILIQTIVDETIQLINSVIYTLKQELENITNIVTNKINTAFKNISNQIQNKINSAINKVNNTIDNAVNKITTICNKETNKVVKSIKKETYKIEKNINKNIKKMQKIVTNQSKDVKTDVEKYIKQIKRNFNDIKNSIEDIIDNLKNTAINLYKNSISLINEAKENFDKLVKEGEKSIIDIKNIAQSNFIKSIEIINNIFDEGPFNYIIREYENWSGYQAKGIIVFIISNGIFLNLYMFPWGKLPCTIAEQMFFKHFCFYVWGLITLFYYYIVYFVLFKNKRNIKTTPLHTRIFNKVVVDNCELIKKKSFISCYMWVNILYILIIWGITRKIFSSNVYNITGVSSLIVLFRNYLF